MDMEDLRGQCVRFVRVLFVSSEITAKLFPGRVEVSECRKEGRKPKVATPVELRSLHCHGSANGRVKSERGPPRQST